MHKIQQRALSSAVQQLAQGASAAQSGTVISQLAEALLAGRDYALFRYDPGSRHFHPVGGTLRCPHGADMDLSATDQQLHQELQHASLLRSDQLAHIDAPLLKRLHRRANQPWHLAVVRQAADDFLLALPGPLDARPISTLETLSSLCAALSDLAQADAPESLARLLDADPSPALLCDSTGERLIQNPAATTLADRLECDSWRALLPRNHAALLASVVRRLRPIVEVETDVGDHILLWTYIAFDRGQRVLLRCRDATTQRRTARQSQQIDRIHRLITENTTDLISRHDARGRFLYASPASMPLLGYMPRDLMDQSLETLVHPADHTRMADDALADLAERGFHTMTCRLRRRDGAYRWFEIAIRAIRDTYTGTILELICVSRDVTERRRAEEETRRLAAVVANTTDLVLFADARGRILHFNRAAGQALGLQHPLRDPVTVRQVLDAHQTDGLDERLLPEPDEADVWEGEGRLVPLHQGASFPASLVMITHGDETGGGNYCSVIARDMTDRELREELSRHHQEELAHAARLTTMGELASGIAHEMNQPLAAIVNYANACLNHLKRDESDTRERLRDGLERIADRARHAAEVIRRLRAFVRKGQRQIVAVNVDTVVEETIAMVQWEARRHGVYLRYTAQPDLPAVAADPVLLAQVLVNLLRNGVEATREGGARTRPTVEVSSSLAGPDAGSVQILVTDHGPGLPEEELEAIFQPFHSSKQQGLGLGLTISRSIIEQLGGELTASRQAHNGMEFRVILPAWTRDETAGAT